MPEEAEAKVEEPKAGPSEAATEAFILSATFNGAKPRYVYKNDDCGLGYYLDVPLAERLKAAKEAQKAKPVIVKANNSLLKSLQKRGPQVSLPVPSGASKKSKTDDNKEPSSRYLKEMERYQQMSCASDTKHDRPLVK